MVFVVAVFFLNFFEMGVVKSFGVFLADISFQLHTDYAKLGIIIGMYHGVTFFIGKSLKDRSTFLMSAFILCESRKEIGENRMEKV